jgi:hypothetical protein
MSCAAVRLPLRDSDRLIETVKSTTGRPIEIENEICIDLMGAVTLSSRALLIGLNLCCYFALRGGGGEKTGRVTGILDVSYVI